MSRVGDVFENPVTGERVVARVGTEESGGDLLVADLYVRPGGAVAGEHVHTRIEEWFTVMGGRVGFRLDGHEISSRRTTRGCTCQPAWPTTGGTPGRRRASRSRSRPGPGSRR